VVSHLAKNWSSQIAIDCYLASSNCGTFRIFKSLSKPVPVGVEARGQGLRGCAPQEALDRKRQINLASGIPSSRDQPGQFFQPRKGLRSWCSIMPTPGLRSRLHRRCGPRLLALCKTRCVQLRPHPGVAHWKSGCRCKSSWKCFTFQPRCAPPAWRNQARRLHHRHVAPFPSVQHIAKLLHPTSCSYPASFIVPTSVVPQSRPTRQPTTLEDVAPCLQIKIRIQILHDPLWGTRQERRRSLMVLNLGFSGLPVEMMAPADGPCSGRVNQEAIVLVPVPNAVAKLRERGTGADRWTES
jgi:hypothetical protein